MYEVTQLKYVTNARNKNESGKVSKAEGLKLQLSGYGTQRHHRNTCLHFVLQQKVEVISFVAEDL